MLHPCNVDDCFHLKWFECKSNVFEIENVTICKNNAKKCRVEQKERTGVLKVLIFSTLVLRKGRERHTEFNGME